MRKLLPALVVLYCLAAPASGVAAERGLDLGFFDYEFTGPDAGRRAAWLDGAASSGANILRVHVRWAAVAPTRPQNAADPNDAAYHWGTVDDAVQGATSRGMRVMLSIHYAPTWAQGPGRPRKAPSGSWKPSPGALAAFAGAAARRYPSVRHWQIWNEPESGAVPQPSMEAAEGSLGSGGCSELSEDAQRRLHGAQAGQRGESRRSGRHSSLWRSAWRDTHTSGHVLARRAQAAYELRHLCPPSLLGPSPRRHALSPLDVSVPDLGRLTRLVRAAVRTGRAVPRKPKPLWITEMGWDSNPPDPNGVPQARHARWLADAMYVLWKQGAQAAFWFTVRDESSTGGFDITSQAGVYQRSGVPKLAQQAFRFPVACEKTGKRRRLRVWGKAPAAGRSSCSEGLKWYGD